MSYRFHQKIRTDRQKSYKKVFDLLKVWMWKYNVFLSYKVGLIGSLLLGVLLLRPVWGPHETEQREMHVAPFRLTRLRSLLCHFRYPTCSPIPLNPLFLTSCRCFEMKSITLSYMWKACSARSSSKALEPSLPFQAPKSSPNPPQPVVPYLLQVLRDEVNHFIIHVKCMGRPFIQ